MRHRLDNHRCKQLGQPFGEGDGHFLARAGWQLDEARFVG